MLFGLEGFLAGQAAVEYGLGVGRAATSTAPAKGLGKSVGAVMGNLDKALKAGQETSNSGSPAATRFVGPVAPAAARPKDAAAAPTAAPVVPAPTYEDPRTIQVGLASDELIRRFGPPSLEVTGASSRRLLTYSGKEGVIELQLQDGKVILVAATKPRQNGVILPR